MIEREIEVFRADTRASRGITAAQLAEVASYDCAAKPVPLCFGHPKNDTPAAGTIGGFRVEGNRLFAKVAALTDKAIDGIKSGEWLDRSMAFFDPTHEANPTPGKWAPRHVGLLGGAAPGIPGMAPLKRALSFDADGGLLADGDPAPAWIEELRPTPMIFTAFDSKEPAPMADRTPEEIAAEDQRIKDAQAALDQREQEFAARESRMFEAANTATVDSLVAAGKVLPAEVPALKLVFNALDRDELEFGAADKSDKATASAKLASFLASALPARVQIDSRVSPNTQFAAGDKPTNADDITAKARKLAADKGLTFEAAVAEVSGEA